MLLVLGNKNWRFLLFKYFEFEFFFFNIRKDVLNLNNIKFIKDNLLNREWIVFKKFKNFIKVIRI